MPSSPSSPWSPLGPLSSELDDDELSDADAAGEKPTAIIPTNTRLSDAIKAISLALTDLGAA